MQIAILSDIHSNLDALKCVLGEVRMMQIDTLLIAGDFVGYYFEFHALFSELDSFDVYACKGNHDEQYIQFLKGQYLDIDSKYNYKNIMYDCERKKDLLFLDKLESTLEVELDGIKFLVCHGSPWDKNQYVYPDTDFSTVGDYSNLAANVIVQGHTHYQMLEMIGEKLLINPGSVGQPRSKNSQTNSTEFLQAQWAIFDTKSRAAKHITSYYDGRALLKRCELEAPDNIYIQRVLQR